MRKLALTFAILIATTLYAQPKPAISGYDIEDLQGKIVALTPCAAGTVACGQTATGRVSVDSCRTSSNIYAVGYAFNGTAGQKVTISGRSPEFAATVILADGRSGNNTIYAQNDQFVDGATATISGFTLPYTGPYIILITPGVPVEFGDYTLTVTCENVSSGACVANATTACLLDGRFRVSIAFINQFANPPAPGNFLGAKLVAGSQNPDVATFGISSAQAIEVVVRVQDTRPFGLNRFDIYYGGLTDLEYTVSVTDTVKGTTKTYRNPPGTVGGSVDRTTFTAN
ncbi:MAG TPA: hypothetical protein VEO54_19355 [Thermoanaerobaculia bacterium]|nr:hypothetical protein [Thermoanaerobaculia bacterium]